MKIEQTSSEAARQYSNKLAMFLKSYRLLLNQINSIFTNPYADVLVKLFRLFDAFNDCLVTDWITFVITDVTLFPKRI